MFKIALIGAGMIAGVHAQSIARMEGVTLRAVCDLDESRAESIAAPQGAESFTDFGSLSRSSTMNDVDLVLVCLPTHLHEEVVRVAAQHGKHVFSEKPIALSLAAAERMAEACDKAGVALGVGHVVRFFPEYVAAKARLDAEEAGKIGTVRTFRGGAYPRAWDNWYGDEARSGGVLVDLLIHDLDFVDAAVGRLDRLFARRIAESSRTDRDYALVVGRLESGAVLHMEASWAHAAGFRYGFEFAGDRGMIEFDSTKIAPVTVTTRASKEAGKSGATVPESPLEKSPYQLELEAYVKALAEGERPPVDGRAAIRALRLSLAALESSRTGQAVSVST